MECLLNDDAYIGGIGLRVSDRDRLLLLADLADTLARLHAMDIVVGDLSPKNLLFSVESSPECFLIDCDAMRLNGAEALPQVETPDWRIPADERKGTPQSDAYKFALLVIRVFARDQAAADPGRLAAVSPALADLAAAALRQPPPERPAPAQWSEQLRREAQAASTAPTAVPPPPAPVPSPQGPGYQPVPPKKNAFGLIVGIGAGVIGVGVFGLLLAMVAVNAVAGFDASSSSTPSSLTLDDQSTDTTPLTPAALLPDSFTTAKGVRYTLRAGGVDKCPDTYHDGDISSALRKARCGKMVTGAYVNPGVTANTRIMVAVWVVPLKNATRAATAYGRVSDAYAENWGIVCPRKGPGSGLCDSGSWGDAQTYGWTGSTHRYLIHTMAIYTNRATARSAAPWLKDASKAGYHAVGPMVYHDGD